MSIQRRGDSPAHGTDNPSRLQQRGTVKRSLLRRLGFLVGRTMKAYFDDNISRLGAALAYYTTFAVAPLLVLAIALAGFFFHDGTARQRVLGEIEQLAGSDVSEAIGSVGHSADRPVNTWATVAGVVTLGVGALGVFMHLQNALNSIWRVESRPGEHWLGMLKRRLFSFGTVVVTGFLLLVALIVSAALSWAGANVGQLMGIPEGLLQSVNFVLSFAMVAFLFAAIFKILPDVTIRWRDVWLGAIVTALLFNIGKEGMSLYFTKAKVASSYGVAGSVIALLIWSYYAGQIVFVGAEFTRVRALTDGGRHPEALDDEKPRTDSSQRGAGPARTRKRREAAR